MQKLDSTKLCRLTERAFTRWATFQVRGLLTLNLLGEETLVGQTYLKNFP